MSTRRTFSASRVNYLRGRAERVARAEAQGPDGWSKSEVDPMALLALFTPLRLKAGLVLRAYQYRAGGNGNGVVWAVPAETPFPEPSECELMEDGFLAAPRPPFALPDVMAAIEGDGSPWSYVCASVFAREAEEFGALWHGTGQWGVSNVMGGDPWADELAEGPRTPVEEWAWKAVPPQDWRPAVTRDSENTTAVIYAYTALGQEQIYRIVDVYPAGSYQPHTQSATIAVGGSGFVF